MYLVMFGMEFLHPELCSILKLEVFCEVLVLLLTIFFFNDLTWKKSGVKPITRQTIACIVISCIPPVKLYSLFLTTLVILWTTHLLILEYCNSYSNWISRNQYPAVFSYIPIDLFKAKNLENRVRSPCLSNSALSADVHKLPNSLKN